MCIKLFNFASQMVIQSNNVMCECVSSQRWALGMGLQQIMCEFLYSLPYNSIDIGVRIQRNQQSNKEMPGIMSVGILR